jgi:hypothetical protein
MALSASSCFVLLAVAVALPFVAPMRGGDGLDADSVLAAEKDHESSSLSGGRASCEALKNNMSCLIRKDGVQVLNISDDFTKDSACLSFCRRVDDTRCCEFSTVGMGSRRCSAFADSAAVEFNPRPDYTSKATNCDPGYTSKTARPQSWAHQPGLTSETARPESWAHQ